MNEIDAWQAFFHSGSVYDYLVYKCIHDNGHQEEPQKKDEEIYNQRTDNQGTEYR
ncbi:MAG: hypothetical protein PUD53_06320 [Oscillospiraceae bacterium]|nr:hypothetical protein [Oscillospiraceae bacterium]